MRWTMDQNTVSARLAGQEILVTGGAGYIGAHAVKALREIGCRVAVLDNLERGHAAALRAVGVEPAGSAAKPADKKPPAVFHQADLRDAAAVDKVFAAHRFAGVVHFAGLALVGESVQNPEIYFQTNVAGGLNLLGACRRHNVSHFVFSSTCAVYGTPQAVPIGENHPRSPLSPYGVSKAHFEDALAAWYDAYGLNFIAFRYFNAAGADPSGEIGEDHNPESHLIPNVLRAAAGVLPHLTIFGRDYPTPDGTCIRDYIHVLDLARAHVLGLAYLLNGGESGAMNLGTGQGLSVLDILRACERETNAKVKVEYGARRPGDAPALVAAPGKAKDVLGFVPEFSDIKTIVAHAWNRHKKFPKGYPKN